MTPISDTGLNWPTIARPEADLVCQALLDGQDVMLVGERGLGKTTVLQMVADTLTDYRRHPVSINLAEFLESRDIEDALARRMREPQRDPSKAVVLVDEVDALPADLIGPAARAINAGRTEIPAVFASSDADAVRQITSRGSNGEPLYVSLSRIPDSDLQAYLLERFAGAGPSIAPVIGELTKLTDGHPLTAILLTRCLLQFLAEGGSVEQSWAETLEVALRDLREPFRQLWASHTNETDRQVIRALAAGSRSLFAAETLEEFELSKSGASRARDRLLKSGVIRRGNDGEYRLADPLFALWIKSGRRTADASDRSRRVERPVRPDPFGSPDAANAELSELQDDFVPVAVGRIGDSQSKIEPRARVIVGRKGSGKTLYLRRLQAAASRDPSVYADRVSAKPPPTSDIVRVWGMYPPHLLTETWMSLWRAAILRSAATHLLYAAIFASHISDSRALLQEAYQEVGGRSTVPLPVGVELRDVIFAHGSGATLDRYLANPEWHELEYHIGEALRQAPPISFYLDGLDEEFRHAPRQWLACQKGLFYEVMRQLRDPMLGGRLRLVIGIRDVVFSSVLTSEHATRYQATAHVQILNWTAPLIRRFLEAKIERLPSDLMMRPAHQSPMTAWLGRETLVNSSQGTSEHLADYLIRHTRLLPRDVIILGNELSRAVSEAKTLGTALSDAQILETVARSARLFGHEQLSICANQIAGDSMPAVAVRHDFVESYIGDGSPDTGGATHAYGSAIETLLVDTLRKAKTDRFSARVLRVLNEDFRAAVGEVDVLSILWQNGVIGYINEDNEPTFHESGGSDDLQLPHIWKTYVLHPTLIDVLALRSGLGTNVKP
ncbi:MAG TPA: ATP-binding protein [Solirubrobacteraceae bacterium]|jgi:hypothetical protein|nr:ATP-binding protein [Solirubrobacteraceae bacterium]